MTHKIIAAVYILCAAVQYNDPDFYIWVPIYLIPAVVAIAYDRGWRNSKILLALCIFFILGMLVYTPDVFSWIKNGTPTITGSMKAENPFVEFVREFFGLGICLIGIIAYHRLVKRDNIDDMS